MIKKLAITVATLAFVASGFAQGVVSNSNRDTTRGVDAPVFQGDGVTGLDSGYVAQLYGGADAGSMVAIGSIVPFRDGTGAGYWNAPLAERTEGVAVAGVAAGGDATFQVFAWEAGFASLGEAQAAGITTWGQSEIFTAAVGSPALAGPPAVPAAPTALVGLTSFSLNVPEPTTIALGLMGLGLVALRSRKK
jgi:hypothetical protein